MKVILWSIRTFWYKGLAKIKEKWRARKKGLYSEKIIARTEKRFSTKGSKNQWIWHFYNVFRSANSIQIQPIIQILINKRKPGKQIWIWFEISHILFIYCPAYSTATTVWPGLAACIRKAAGPGEVARRLPSVTRGEWFLSIYACPSRQGNRITSFKPILIFLRFYIYLSNLV